MNYYAISSLIPILTYWLILVIGSVYIFIKGRHVYKLVKGSLIGKITRVLVFAMLAEMYIFGIITTVFLYGNEKSLFLVMPVFFIWFIAFISSLKVLIYAGQEAEKIINNQ